MVKAIVLAAGRGARLKSKTPKVLHRIFDKPVLSWVLDALAEVELEEIIVVCGYKAEAVKSFLHAYPVTTVIQEEQLGTGHALMCVDPYLKDYEGTVIVLNGDSPLIRSETINELIDYHEENMNEITLTTTRYDKPNSYGRIIRKGSEIMAIKEYKDSSEAEKAIKEVNAGIYCMEWQNMRQGLVHLKNNNAQEEYYITDLVAWAYSQRHAVGNINLANLYEMVGINTREDLALVIKLKNEVALQELMANGVTIIDPSNTVISSDADIGPDTIIFPGTYIHRRVMIGAGCVIGPHTSIFGPAEIGAGSSVVHSHIDRSSIGQNSNIGPFAHIREGADISDGVRVGSFVEVKNTSIGEGSAAAHLSYLGDSKIKAGVNIGAGTVIANFDPRTGLKHKSVIKTGAATGANSVIVSPVEIGENSMIAAGSVITKDVPPNTLAIARPRQEHRPNHRKQVETN